ncbi:MAG: S-adenosylmethionine decarboxylase [Clostridiales bacterium]|nr:S-adenosylmethionine decarboxylase [Clostridiales bacterium]
MNHIMIDGYRASENRLDDIKTVNSVLNEIVQTLNIDSVMPPFLLPYYYAKDGDDDGISAFVLLEGGHITIHTFPRRGCLFVDLLYDGYFDEDKLCSILRRTFHYEPDDEKTLRTERRFYNPSMETKSLHGDFGPHIIARLEDVDVSFEQIFDMLDVLPESTNMIPICRPYVLKTKEYVCGVVLIAQSHIAFHYCVKEKTLFADLFSCSFYKSDYFIDFLRKQFNVADVNEKTLVRGSKHDKQISNRERKIKSLSRWQKRNI